MSASESWDVSTEREKVKPSSGHQEGREPQSPGLCGGSELCLGARWRCEAPDPGLSLARAQGQWEGGRRSVLNHRTHGHLQPFQTSDYGGGLAQKPTPKSSNIEHGHWTRSLWSCTLTGKGKN